MVIISNKYKIIKNLGEGAFGKVFECQIIKKDINAAIKIQPKDLPNVLKNEAKIYKFLHGINGVPKLFNLGMFDGYNYLVIEKFKETIISKIPSARLGEPDDIANAVVFLCSNQSDYINGETLHVNGGMYMA